MSALLKLSEEYFVGCWQISYQNTLLFVSGIAEMFESLVFFCGKEKLWKTDGEINNLKYIYLLFVILMRSMTK